MLKSKIILHLLYPGTISSWIHLDSDLPLPSPTPCSTGFPFPTVGPPVHGNGACLRSTTLWCFFLATPKHSCCIHLWSRLQFSHPVAASFSHCCIPLVEPSNPPSGVAASCRVTKQRKAGVRVYTFPAQVYVEPYLQFQHVVFQHFPFMVQF